MTNEQRLAQESEIQYQPDGMYRCHLCHRRISQRTPSARIAGFYYHTNHSPSLRNCEYTADGGTQAPRCGKPAVIFNPHGKSGIANERWFDYDEWFCAEHADPAWLGQPVPSQHTKLSIDVPYYVHPQALEIGRVVRDMLGDDTRLVVVRVEPALIVVDPDGNERSLLAHLAEVLE